MEYTGNEVISISLVHLPFSSGSGGVSVAPVTTCVLSTPVLRLCTNIPILIGSGGGGTMCVWSW